MNMKDSLFLLMSNVLGRGLTNAYCMMDSLFLLISNVLGRGCWAGEGAH